MKKTLIAAAALAVAGAASAQVTLSGTLAFGYWTSVSSAGYHQKTYGADTANVVFSASEDLGGGLKVNGSLAFERGFEDVAANGNGASLGISGGFGSFVMSGVEGSDYLPVDGLTAVANGGDANRLTYTSPKINGFTVSVTASNSNGSVMRSGTDQGNGSAATYAVAYSAGPLSVDGGMVAYGSNGNTRDTIRMARASYDMGVAKVTYGMLRLVNVSADSVTETGLTVAVPVGNLAVTAGYATSKTGSAARKNGYSLAAAYSLSKRTSINWYTESYDNAAGLNAITESSLMLKHTF